MSAPARLVLVAAAAIAASGLAAHQTPQLIVHEWGTFTTVAGQDGRSIEWLPLGGPQDLPCFVYTFDRRNVIKGLWNGETPLTYDQARAAMRGTVRMETPVLYFYAPAPMWANVSVSFPQGLLSEWYPFASVTQPGATATGLRNWPQSVMRWNNVEIRPATTPTLPTESAPSHYYAARAVDAAPVRVGSEDEQFLFYRGVGGFQPPIATTVDDQGRVEIVNQGPAPIDGVILFENRGGKVGYRVHGTLRGRATIPLPPLTADIAGLHRSLEETLVASGLYAKEARAMIETWRDSWFEEGTRVLYLVPGAVVDEILPLQVSPAPVEIVRTFVGRMEVMTPATLARVSHAIAEADDASLMAFGRFMGPIAERVLTNATAADRARILGRVETVYKAYVDKLSARCGVTS